MSLCSVIDVISVSEEPVTPIFKAEDFEISSSLGEISSHHLNILFATGKLVTM
jgi:hypothetical protein